MISNEEAKKIALEYVLKRPDIWDGKAEAPEDLGGYVSSHSSCPENSILILIVDDGEARREVELMRQRVREGASLADIPTVAGGVSPDPIAICAVDQSTGHVQLMD